MASARGKVQLYVMHVGPIYISLLYITHMLNWASDIIGKTVLNDYGINHLYYICSQKTYIC